MKALPLRPRTVLGAGVMLGIIGNVLVRGHGGPGLNMLVMAAAMASATLLLYLRSEREVDAESVVSLSIGVLFAGGAAWRDSPALELLGLGCAAVAFALPAFRAGAAWIRSGGVTEYAASLAVAGIHAVFGAALVIAAVDRWPGIGRPGRWGRAAAVARGVALATPFIIVFGALFMAADVVFADIVTNIVRVDFELVTSHVLVTAVLAWFAIGYLRGCLVGTQPVGLTVPLRDRARLRITEAATALALLDLLFLAFVIVQLRYLFGGSGLVEITPGLTYAEYARRGFFELVAVAALVLPLLLATDWLLRRESDRDKHIFRALTGVQIVLVLVITASALQRMRIYQEAYGLTELRLYVTAVLILIAAVLVWFTATVLRGARQSFAFGALVAGFATVATLYAMNPDAIIARTNIARVQAGVDEGTRFDIRYATSLSADAVPVLAAALPTLPDDARCHIARGLLRRWAPDQPVPVRGWSWSVARAHREVRANEDLLRRLAGAGQHC